MRLVSFISASQFKGFFCNLCNYYRSWKKRTQRVMVALAYSIAMNKHLFSCPSFLDIAISVLTLFWM